MWTIIVSFSIVVFWALIDVFLSIFRLLIEEISIFDVDRIISRWVCNSQSSLKSYTLQRDLLQRHCLTKLIVIVVEILHWLSWWIVDVLRIRDNVRRSRRVRRVRRLLSLLLRSKSMLLDTFVCFVRRAIRKTKSSCENCLSQISFDL